MSDDREKQIRERAHAIWLEEGSPSGRHEEHWEQATKDVDSSAAPAKAPATRTPRAKAAATTKDTPPGDLNKPVTEAAAPKPEASVKQPLQTRGKAPLPARGKRKT